MVFCCDALAVCNSHTRMRKMQNITSLFQNGLPMTKPYLLAIDQLQMMLNITVKINAKIRRKGVELVPSMQKHNAFYQKNMLALSIAEFCWPSICWLSVDYVENFVYDHTIGRICSHSFGKECVV
jgi:hypothetical protein